jgi:hypothetical protein
MSNFNINNVTFFRGHTVINGQVDISNDEYQEFLNEIHGDVTICGMTYGQGDALEALDPVAFRCGLGDYESEIQSELEEAIENEDDSEIEWEDGKEPDELDALEEQE